MGQYQLGDIIWTWPHIYNGYIYDQGDPIVVNGLVYQSVNGTDSGAYNAVNETKYFFGHATYTNGNDVLHPVGLMNSSSQDYPRFGQTNWDRVSGGTPQTYTYSFNANGGSGAPSAMTKTYGVHFTFPTTKPTRTGYTFNGWSTSNTATSGYSAGQEVVGLEDKDIVWYATWAKTIKLTYDGNKGNGSTSVSSVPSAQSATIYNSTTSYKFTLSNTKPTRTGYTFLGWSTSSTATSARYSAGGNITLSDSDILYAVWDANPYPYNIVYKSSSGVQLGTGTVTKDFDTTNSISPKSFTGYTSPSSQSVTWNSTSAKTITFTYSPINYPISYTLNGGTVSSTNPTSYNIETATFTLKNPTKTGYTFTGWTGSNGSAPSTNVSISKGSSGNKSFTANWIEHKLTVNYYSNYATYADFAEGFNLLNPVLKNSNVLVHSREFKYDDEYSSGLHNYSESGNALYMKRLGYSATGQWGTEPDGGILIGEDDSFNSGQSIATKVGLSLATGNASINLYAQWNPANIAYYKIDGQWKLCHTYYKIDGVWKPVIMFKKINGTWKRSILK